jgi:hypothetical protein
MGFSAHPSRLYEFFDDQEFQFLYNPEETYKAGMARRERRRKDALMALKAEFVEEEVRTKRYSAPDRAQAAEPVDPLRDYGDDYEPFATDWKERTE